jgi:hypothetical protein
MSSVAAPYSHFSAPGDLDTGEFSVGVLSQPRDGMRAESPVLLLRGVLKSRTVLENVDRPSPDQQRRSVLPAGVPARAVPGTHAGHAAIRRSVAGLRQHAILVCRRRDRSTWRICARLVTRSPVRLGRRPRASGWRPFAVSGPSRAGSADVGVDNGTARVGAVPVSCVVVGAGSAPARRRVR